MQENKNYTVMSLDNFIDICMEYEKNDPIDWGELPIKERDAYKDVCEELLEMINNIDDVKEREIVVLTSLAKSIVENTVLQAHKILYEKSVRIQIGRPTA